MYTELDSSLTKDEKLLKETVHEFAKGVMRPAGLAVEQMNSQEEVIQKGSVWWDARKKAREMGYHLIGLPKSLGGFEAKHLELHIILEEFGWGSLGLGLSIFLDAFPTMFVLKYQPENKRLMDEIVKPYVENVEETISACSALSEPDHGSDVLFAFRQGFHDPKMAFDTSALLQGDEWVINGQKAGWVSDAPIATHVMTLLTVYDGKEMVGGGIALVPMDSPGVSRGEPIMMLGSRDFPQCEIFFDNVRIPKDNMLVGPELYEGAMDELLNGAGVAVGSALTGLARAAFEEALEYSKRRIQGGKRIADHQIIQLKLFDMFTKVEAARALSRAAMKHCHTTVDPVYSSTTKVFCSQMAFEVANAAVQIYGGYGLSRESLVSKLFRDARCQLVGDGCNEVVGMKRAHDIIKNYRA